MDMGGGGGELTEEGDEVPVAVAVRVAPPLDGLANNPFNPPAQLCIQVNPLTNELYLGPDRTFNFDYLYGPNSLQDEVFCTSVEPLLTPFLDGYNVTVLLYGASGTGKTYSLVGPELSPPAINEEKFGVIPRLVRALFRDLGGLVSTKTVLEVSYVDIFNEEVRDLLSDDMTGVMVEQGHQLAGVTHLECQNISEVLSCLGTGQALHRTGGLNILNSNSLMAQPGSHTVFSLKLGQSCVQDGATIFKQSTFQFVDLAASDKLTGHNGAINLGLLALGNVVSALGDPRRNVSYVPYQDSLLTRVVSPALGGSSVTLFLCTVSPLARDSEETLNTLLTACRAANIKNCPVPNILREEVPSISPPQPLLLSPHNQNLYQHSPTVTPLDSRRGSSSSVFLQSQFSQQQGFPVQYQNHVPHPHYQNDLSQFQNSMPQYQNIPTHYQNSPSTHPLSPIHQQNSSLQYQYRPSQPLNGFQPPGQPQMVNGHNFIQGPNNQFTRPGVQVPINQPHPFNSNRIPDPQQVNPISPNQVSNPPYSYTNPFNIVPLSPTNQPITARTTPISTSPLSHRSNIGVSLYLPPNNTTSSINNSTSLALDTTPLMGNQGHMILNISSHNEDNLTAPRPAALNMLEDGLLNEQNEEMFNLQFAASQYKSLVSNAENLLNNISQNEEVQGTEKKEIEVWMCKKEESEQAIRKSGEENTLEKILEESEDETEDSSSKTETASFTKDSDMTSQESIAEIESVEDFDSECSDMSDIDSKLEVIQIQFRRETESVVSDSEVCYWNKIVLKPEDAQGSARNDAELENEKENMAIVEEDLIKLNEPNLSLESQLRLVTKETESHQGKVNEAEQDMRRVKTQLLNLQGVIKAKEYFIKDLLNTSKQTEQAKEVLEEKLKKLEKESRQTQIELSNAQSVLKELESKSGNSNLESEYRIKVNNYQTQIRELEQKVKNTEKTLMLTKPESKKIKDLQENLLSLKEQHEKLQHRLKEEQERKKSLELALHQDQDVIKDLKNKLEFQNQLLKESIEASREIDVKKQWLRQEEERLTEMKYEVEQLQDSVKKRELNISLKENQIQETSFINGEMVPLNPIRKTLQDEITLRNEIHDLRTIRGNLVSERQYLDDKLNENKTLSSKEERRMVELDESVEAIDSAIEYKNDIICDKNVAYDTTYKGDDILMQKLVKINLGETRALLHRYFIKVLDLRLEGRKMEVHLEEVEEQYGELGKYVRDLAHSLQRTKLDCERRLVAQQRDYQVKINLLVQQLAESGSGGEAVQEGDRRIKSLEKEVHYYKKLCKELRKGHEPVNLDGGGRRPHHDVGGGGDLSSRPASVVSHIQPGHIEQFQRRLAKLQKKMGDAARPTVTREARKLIIEQPVSANSSMERGQGRRKR